MAQMYWIIPVEGGGGRPDNSLPGGQGGHPSQPIYHPGHPDHGYLPYPDQAVCTQRRAGRTARPGLAAVPRARACRKAGRDIPSNELPMPQPPAGVSG